MKILPAVAKARFARWREKHAARLAAMHPDVASEVQSVVMDRFAVGGESGLSDEDLRRCKMRVASRLRIKRYGACTDDEETGRQLRECVATLDAAGAQGERQGRAA